MRTRIFKLLEFAEKNFCTKVPENGILLKRTNNLEVGQKVSVERKITDDDVLAFAKLTGDYNPIHMDPKMKIVHGAFLNGLLSGVLGTKLPGPGTIVIEQLLRYPKPCFAGDSVQILVELSSLRKIIKCKYSIIANSERIVLEGEGKFVMSDLDHK